MLQLNWWASNHYKYLRTVLSWHVQNVAVITLLHFEWVQINIVENSLADNGKVVSEMDSWSIAMDIPFWPRHIHNHGTKLFSYGWIGFYYSPWSKKWIANHFTNEFSIMIQICYKFHFALIQICTWHNNCVCYHGIHEHFSDNMIAKNNIMRKFIFYSI